MLPILDPTPGEEHWTLMIIDKRGGPMQADFAVRYYDTLTTESMASRLIAAKILKEMCPGHPEVRLPRRRNCSQQGPLACGFAVIWYMEEELIASAIGAGYGCRGWFNESRARKELHNLGSNMLSCEQRMRREEQVMHEKLQALILMTEDKVKTKDAITRQREEAFLAALKAAADFTDGFDMPEDDVGPEAKEVIDAIAEEMGVLIAEPLPPIPPPPDEELALPPPPEESFAPPPAKSAKLSKPFSDLFSMKKDEELQSILLQLRDEQIEAQRTQDDFESWAADAMKLLSPKEQHTAKLVQLAGLSICGGCQWRSGCAKCDFSKCVRYFFNQALLQCGLSKEAVRARRVKSVCKYGS